MKCFNNIKKCSVTSSPLSVFIFVNALVDIGMAVGVTLGIFCVFLIILIGFIVYWRRYVTIN